MLLLLDCTEGVDAGRLLLHDLLQPFLACEFDLVDSRWGPAFLAPCISISWRKRTSTGRLHSLIVAFFDCIDCGVWLRCPPRVERLAAVLVVYVAHIRRG